MTTHERHIVSEGVTRFLKDQPSLFIDGEHIPAGFREVFPVYDPGTGEVITHAIEATKEDVDKAVAAARRAFEKGPWRQTKPNQRTLLMWRLAELMEQHTGDLAQLETLDNGMPLSASKVAAVGASVEMLRYMAGWATKIYGESIDVSIPGDFHAYTLHEPVGVVGQIVPWNGPLLMAIWKIAPALAAGCTCILKPAEQTPLTASYLGRLIKQAGIPDGVINIVTGSGKVGAMISSHQDVDKVAFTGSTATGRHIIEAAARSNLKRVSLELGGKSPIIVFPDADLSAAIPGAAQAIFTTNAGQVCSAGSRLFVHRKNYDRFVEGLAETASGIRFGYGLDDASQMGPLISVEQFERVSGYVEGGRKDGASVLTGGEGGGDRGYFYKPTVLAGARPDMTAVREEIFGPVVCALPFDDDDLDRIAEQANDTPYGLAASIWTRDISIAHKMAKRVKAGIVGINRHHVSDNATPFGGYKQSGWGRERGRDVLELYTSVKAVTVAL
jgi:phenylacetaldehyde dehydrogenase